MRVLAAYMMAVLAGNDSPSEADITKILDSVGSKADADELKKVVSELSGKNLNELITQGQELLAAVPGGGGGGGGAAGAAAGGDAGGDAAAAEPEKVESEEEESEGDMGFSLFD